MDLSRIVKGLIAIVLVFVAWKYVAPMVKEKTSGIGKTSSSSSAGGGSSPCINAADRASSTWGGGLNRFINPPYDMQAWSDFKNEVDSQISQANSQCSCSEESCSKVRGAMSDLSNLVAQMDTAIRNGSQPPGDAVQRQEAIDNQIDAARDLVRAGK